MRRQLKLIYIYYKGDEDYSEYGVIVHKNADEFAENIKQQVLQELNNGNTNDNVEVTVCIDIGKDLI